MISVPYASFNWIRFYELAFASQPWHQPTGQTNAPQQIITLASHSGNFKREDHRRDDGSIGYCPQTQNFQKILPKFSINEHLFFVLVNYTFPKK
jgi:hypothetical protein